MPLSSRREVTRFVHKKLLFRLRRLAIFFIVIATVVIYEVSQNYIAGYMATGGFILGYVIGLSVRRMHLLSWDTETNKTVTRMDRIGIAILVIYLLFVISRKWIFSYWLQGHALTAFTFSVAAGAILGRLFTLRKNIRQILKKEGFLHPGKQDKPTQ